jgi:DNA-binding response OmpR family regulator
MKGDSHEELVERLGNSIKRRSFANNDGGSMDWILIAEDDQRLQKALKRLFESEGYGVEISGDGKSALEAFRKTAPAAIILDLGLPVISGQAVCREIRRQSSTPPIVVVSAAIDVVDKVLLLELGADDYVDKPFSPRELLARVRAAIRHSRKNDACGSEILIFDRMSVDFGRLEVKLDGRVVGLTVQEFKLLKFLLQNAERVISREELLKEGFGCESRSRTADNHILKLRQKLERDPANPVHFRTVHGAGYRFVR